MADRLVPSRSAIRSSSTTSLVVALHDTTWSKFFLRGCLTRGLLTVLLIFQPLEVPGAFEPDERGIPGILEGDIRSVQPLSGRPEVPHEV